MILKGVDLSKLVPLTVGDWLALEESGVTLDLIAEGKMVPLVKFMEHVASKSPTTIDIRALTRAELAAAFEFVMQSEPKINRPTSPDSTD